LARIFREAGVARLEPGKRPRAAWRRFVYPAPNACWHLDATEYVLTGGGTCVIFQLIDDHSRYAVASHVASGETAKDAIAVFDKAVAAHGVPQRLLSDNGLALNPSRRGVVGPLVAHVAALGTEAITGKPYKPTTQGKNERFHQTLFRYLDKQPLADTLAELQAQVDAFDHICNTQRPHQGLPGRSTPLAAWEATSTADPPRPKPDRPVYQPPVPALRPRPKPPADPPADTPVTTVNTAATIHVDTVFSNVDVDHAFQQVLIISHGNHAGDKIVITNLDGEILAEHTKPAPGIHYLGNGRHPATRPSNPGMSPKSRHTNRHQCPDAELSPMS
jgi:transposase InsO family protein